MFIEVLARFKYVDESIDWEALGIENPEGESRLMKSVVNTDNIIGVYKYSDTDTALKYVGNEAVNVILVAMPYEEFVQKFEYALRINMGEDRGLIHRIYSDVCEKSVS